MPKTIPTLGAVAQAQAEEEKTQKGKGMIARGLALLGLLPSEATAKPDAKMSKKTVTTKRVEMEEDDSEDEEAEDEGEESTGAEGGDDEEEAEDTSSGADAEDEGDEKESRAEAGNEDRALAAAVAKALNSPAVREAFLAALPEQHRDVGALYAPSRLASTARKATAKGTTLEAMGALAEFAQKSRASHEKMLAKQAKLETRVAKVEGARRKDRVDAIVVVAKERGVPGATSKEGRVMLRDYGMKHGTRALQAFIASQGPGLRTRETLPKTDEKGAVLGLPSSEEQARMMEQAKAGLSAKEREEFDAICAEKLKTMNGAAGVEA